ncbi:hypothetical protein D9M72_485730 [compost metagenome]
MAADRSGQCAVAHPRTGPRDGRCLRSGACRGHVGRVGRAGTPGPLGHLRAACDPGRIRGRAAPLAGAVRIRAIDPRSRRAQSGTSHDRAGESLLRQLFCGQCRRPGGDHCGRHRAPDTRQSVPGRCRRRIERLSGPYALAPGRCGEGHGHRHPRGGSCRGRRQCAVAVLRAVRHMPGRPVVGRAGTGAQMGAHAAGRGPAQRAGVLAPVGALLCTRPAGAHRARRPSACPAGGAATRRI